VEILTSKKSGGDTQKYLASVVIVNWNRRELLERALDSLQTQTEQDFEVIVVDNGSTDGSGRMLDLRASAGYSRPLRVIANSENRGFCAANNQGIAVARGEYIALLNNDAEAGPEWLSAMCQALETRPDYGMAACKILDWDDPRRIDKAGHLIFWDGQNRGRGTGEMDEGQYDQVEDALWPDGCAALYRRSMLAEIGGFDEDFFAYADDAELGLRARIAGWKCIYVPDAVVRHRRGSTLGRFSSRRMELIERNRLLLVWKHFPWWLVCLNGVPYLARAAAGMWAALKGRGELSQFRGAVGKWEVLRALARAQWEACSMFWPTVAKRPKMNSLRKLSHNDLLRLFWRHRISFRKLSRQSI
jgi:GT2 family glycosyltransferase